MNNLINLPKITSFASRYGRRYMAVFVGLAIGVTGLIAITSSRAAGPYLAAEPEQGNITAPAATASDTTASASAAVKFSAGPNTQPTGHYQVNGRFLYDPCGQKVTIRGVENVFWNPWLYPDGSIIPEIAKTKANTIRILAHYAPEPHDGDGIDYLTVPQIENLIQLAIANHMVPDVAIAGGKYPDVYLQPEIKTLLFKYQDKILIHMMGEGQQDTTAQWISESKTNIAKLRAAGYTAPLYILANWGGRQLPTVLDAGAEVLASDPLKNIIFGWQAYWGEPGNYYQNMYGMTLHQAMGKVRDAPFMIQVGLTYETDPWLNNDTMDYRTAMKDAQDYDIGWLWWDWRLSSGTASLTTDGTYGHWEPYGAEIAVTNPYSIANTSLRNTFLNTGSCN